MKTIKPKYKGAVGMKYLYDYIRAVLGTLAWMFLNGLGLTLAISFHGALKWIGYFDYIATGLILMFIISKYMEGDFFKSLGREQ